METSTAPKKRVLYLITKSSWGGATRYVHDLALGAKAEGYAVTVAAGGSGELFNRLAGTGIETKQIDALGRDIHILSEFRAFREIFTVLRSCKPDVLHLNSSKAGLAALAGRLAGVETIIFTVHGWAWNEERPFYQRVFIGLAYFCTILLCHTVIAVSKATAYQGRFLPIQKKNLAVIHNGVRTLPRYSKEEARRRLLPESKRSLWIGTVAELHPVKNLPILIEAYEHFAPDVPDSELVIIGEGQQRSMLERQIRLEGVSGGTHLLGHVPSAGDFLRAFDIFVLPSRSEALAYVILEAGLAEVFVIASEVGGIPEIIEDGKTGILVPPGNRVALTEALVHYSNNTIARKNMTTALQKKVLEEFSVERMCSETFKHY